MTIIYVKRVSFREKIVLKEREVVIGDKKDLLHRVHTKHGTISSIFLCSYHYYYSF